MNKTNTLNSTKVIVGALGLVMAVTLASLPAFASAATYAYVDTTGEVKPVIADTWQQAIAKAVGIHIHSGVMLLDSPSDFDIVGNDVASY
jgi:short subunit dehydrogenase-like uncharacterized protein